MFQKNLLILFLCPTILFGLIANTWAQQNASVTLEEVLVEAPIIEGNQVDDFGFVTTVVSEEQMDSLNAQDLGTALRKTPGISISRYNPIGSFGGGEGGAVFIRGMGSSRPGSEIKTYINDVPMYMSVWNHPLLDLMSIDAADSIEVFKGPQPQKFGNAFAAINLVPKRRMEEGSETKTQLAWGSYDTVIAKAEHGGRKERFDYHLGGGYRSSDGHRTDADGTLQDLYAHIGYQLNNSWDVSLFSLLTDNEASDPGAEGALPADKEGIYETRSFLTSLAVHHQYNQLEGSIKLYHNHGEGDWLDQPTAVPGIKEDLYNDFTFYGVKVKEDLKPWPGGSVLLGFDWEVSEGEYDKELSDGTQADWEGESFNMVSPFLGFNQHLDLGSRVYLQPSVGVRYSEHSDFGGEWTPHAGLIFGYQDMEFYANYARGAVYPGLDVVVFSEEVIPPLGTSWEDLDPEVVDHYELGLRRSFAQLLQVDLSVFVDDGQDRYVFSTPPAAFSYQNIEDFRIRGIEASVQVEPTKNLSLFAGLTLLDTEPSDLPYAPKWSLSSGLNIRFFDHFTLSLDSQYLDEMNVNSQARKSGAANTEDVGSFFLVNGKLSYNFTLENPGVEGELFVAGENLTDTDYEYLPDYPMPGINGMLGISLNL